MEGSVSRCIYDAFKTPDGRTALAWILNECGFFEEDPSNIRPELLAFAHRLLNAGGMSIAGDMGVFVSAILNSHTED